MSTNDAVPLIEPTQDERTYATLAHALQVVGWWIAPLIIFLLHRRSRFVSFHALQALLWQGCLIIFYACFMVGWMAFIFSFAFRQAQGGTPAPPPPGLFIWLPLMWLGFMAIWVFTLVLAIVYAVKAGRGEWANYPVLGGLSRRILKF